MTILRGVPRVEPLLNFGCGGAQRGRENPMMWLMEIVASMGA